MIIQSLFALGKAKSAIAFTYRTKQQSIHFTAAGCITASFRSTKVYNSGIHYTARDTQLLRMNLPRLESYDIIRRTTRSGNNSFKLIISQGSVVNFSYNNSESSSSGYHDEELPLSAIVNAANEQCLYGGGVDGAITRAGGPNLAMDRLNIPIIRKRKAAPTRVNVRGLDVRCPTGDAKITGPNDYGLLHVPYVIHAVGPDFHFYEDDEKQKLGKQLLESAFRQSLERAKEHRIEAVAFSLISSGVYRGRFLSKMDVLSIGMNTISKFNGYDELEEVHLCAYSSEESKTLLDIASKMGLGPSGE